MQKISKNQSYLKTLIDRYYNGEATLDEIKTLTNYYQSFQENDNWDTVLGSEDVAKSRILNNIFNTIKDDKTPFYKHFVFKYAAAAILLLMIALPFVLNKNTTSEFSEPIIVNNNIKTGDSKAILTLEDGNVVVLANGKPFETKTVYSNGNKISYNARTTNQKQPKYNYLTIPKGGEFFVSLEDGTKVWLNSETQLKYPTHFIDGETRKVELVYGEAYFDVSKSTIHGNSKFLVKNKSQEVTVLGTQFNIKAYKNEPNIYTTLVEGKVSVNQNNNNQILMPTEQSVFNINTKKLVVNTVDLYRETAWKDGVFSFRKKPLKDIMVVLSRWYNIEVVFDNKILKEQRFNGAFNRSQKIEEVLSILHNSNIINTYEINNKTITIK